MSRDYSELFTGQLQAQKEKLDENSHKRDFTDLPFSYAWTRIQEEFKELQQECEAIKVDFSYTKIRREAADLANFCGMLILACDKEMEEKK